MTEMSIRRSVNVWIVMVVVAAVAVNEVVVEEDLVRHLHEAGHLLHHIEVSSNLIEVQANVSIAIVMLEEEVVELVPIDDLREGDDAVLVVVRIWQPKTF